MAVNKIQISVIFDQLHKLAVQREEACRINWKERYSELPALYRLTNEELDELSKLKEKPKTLARREETRTTKPVPVSENGVYGWVASKMDFQLETLGPDVMTYIAMPEEFKLHPRGAKRNFLRL